MIFIFLCLVAMMSCAPATQSSASLSTSEPLEDFLYELISNETANLKNSTDNQLSLNKNLKLLFIGMILDGEKGFTTFVKENPNDKNIETAKKLEKRLSEFRLKMANYNVDPYKTLQKVYEVAYTRRYLNTDEVTQKRLIKETISK